MAKTIMKMHFSLWQHHILMVLQFSVLTLKSHRLEESLLQNEKA